MESDSHTFSKLRAIFWPIHNYELKKFLPMAFMMFCALFNYTIARDLKDAFVINQIGAGVIPFLKTFGTMPAAILFFMLYAELNIKLTKKQVFYTCIAPFILFFGAFGLILYPNLSAIQPSAETITNLSNTVPLLRPFFEIFGNWATALFFILAELWGSVAVSLLFWQFANEITTIKEAKRAYPFFGIVANLGLIASGTCLKFFSNQSHSFAQEKLRSIGEASVVPFINYVKKDADFIWKYLNVKLADATPEQLELVKSKKILIEQAVSEGWAINLNYITMIFVFFGFSMMYLYHYVNTKVMTDPKLYDPSMVKKPKKKKAKLGFADSLKLIASSKYLGLITVLVLAYGMSINLIEVVWKAQASKVFPTEYEFSYFRGNFSTFTGIFTIFFTIAGGYILRHCKWRTAASITPIVVTVTAMIFFASVLFHKSYIIGYLVELLSITPLLLAFWVGSAQNLLSKATKYSLFDSTKEMAYIPLSDELKSKGKAAVDVIGGRGGKTLGSAILVGLTSIFAYKVSSKESIDIIAPYLFPVVVVVVIAWLAAVAGLSVLLKKASHGEADVEITDEEVVDEPAADEQTASKTLSSKEAYTV